MRPLTPKEETLLSLLSSTGVPSSFLHITKCGITKGYTDATLSFREFLRGCGVHDFDAQQLGEDNIVYLKVDGWTPNGIVELEISLQRPRAHEGRMFRLSKIGGLKGPLEIDQDDILFVFYRDDRLMFFNLTKIATNASPATYPLEINENRGATITKAAFDRVLRVMSSLPECKPDVGNGAPSRLIAEVSGLEAKGASVSGLVKPLINALLKVGKIEELGTTRRRYRLCL